jgi:hypothetical protein
MVLKDFRILSSTGEGFNEVKEPEILLEVKLSLIFLQEKRLLNAMLFHY